MKDFGGRDLDDGQGTSVRYQDFVLAVDTIAGRHPFEMNTGRYITKLKARYLKDVYGRRLCTPVRSSIRQHTSAYVSIRQHILRD